eukprot:Nk52_evm2s246 gene=Nk52_evmTU2s246
MASRQEERHLKIIKDLMHFKDNTKCCDCPHVPANYVNLTVNSFVCENCASSLRQLSHRVKSISMSTFTQDEIKRLKEGGNRKCRAVYMARYNPETDGNEPDGADKQVMMSFLKKKYEGKAWYSQEVANRMANMQKSSQGSQGSMISLGHGSGSSATLGVKTRRGDRRTNRGSPSSTSPYQSQDNLFGAGIGITQPTETRNDNIGDLMSNSNAVAKGNVRDSTGSYASSSFLNDITGVDFAQKQEKDVVEKGTASPSNPFAQLSSNASTGIMGTGVGMSPASSVGSVNEPKTPKNPFAAMVATSTSEPKKNSANPFASLTSADPSIAHKEPEARGSSFGATAPPSENSNPGDDFASLRHSVPHANNSVSNPPAPVAVSPTTETSTRKIDEPSQGIKPLSSQSANVDQRTSPAEDQLKKKASVPPPASADKYAAFYALGNDTNSSIFGASTGMQHLNLNSSGLGSGSGPGSFRNSGAPGNPFAMTGTQSTNHESRPASMYSNPGSMGNPSSEELFCSAANPFASGAHSASNPYGQPMSQMQMQNGQMAQPYNSFGPSAAPMNAMGGRSGATLMNPMGGGSGIAPMSPMGGGSGASPMNSMGGVGSANPFANANTATSNSGAGSNSTEKATPQQKRDSMFGDLSPFK